MTQSPSTLHASLRVLEPPSTRADNIAGLRRIQDLAVDVVLTNEGPTPARWLSTYAEAGSLALEVRDAACEPVRGGPPPTPRTDDGVTHWHALRPSESVTLHLGTWLMLDKPPGRYEVRFMGIPGDIGNSQLKSAWVPFEVIGPTDGG